LGQIWTRKKLGQKFQNSFRSFSVYYEASKNCSVSVCVMRL
jgi:hypothetical protein